MVKENEELKKRMSGVEEMVANLIVDQQAMAKAFQERGVMDIVIFRTIFFELLVFFTFTLLTIHFAY